MVQQTFIGTTDKCLDSDCLYCEKTGSICLVLVCLITSWSSRQMIHTYIHLWFDFKIPSYQSI